LVIQDLHKLGEEQAAQFVGQKKQVSFNKKVPTSHVVHYNYVDYKQVKHFEEVKQHSLLESKE
jgi:hypothetical protein